ncbi:MULTISPECIES: o-succinylbenzoate synthase [unclassified Niallia]|uniref:o-succinylbenzoate synthase n=1 Tax=unclassified Niallia TaxID=2837522 RepID=UPI001ED9F8CC|nr:MULTISPECIES: o-succinylbenzoate synthase [unclassified Niallia]MDL0437598.1 o-succinylbenzoate synthase [Niallia sp. SS-2023]UPO86681.1 o-succinylbenzoate synthase [Niallia sp. Man26]
MKIERIELLHLKMPLLHPFVTSIGSLMEKDFLIIKMFSGGHVGYGESVAMPNPGYSEETTGTSVHIIEEFLIPLLFSSTINHPDDVSNIFAPIRRNNMAKAALEGAVWDLYSKKIGVSLAHALGGTRKSIDVGVSIGIEKSLDELLLKIERYLADGYKKIKVKIKPGYDLEPLAKIREKFGFGIPLMADANSAYCLQDLTHLKKLDAFKLMMIEQPLAFDDMIDHAVLQKELSTPICLDESIHSAEDARKAIELGSCRIINLKIGRVGGLTEAKKIHDLCDNYNVPVWCGGMLEAGVGRAHNIAITSLANFTIAGDTSASDRYWKEDIIQPEVIMSAPGKIAVPTKPGIGYELNEQVIEKYLLGKKTFTNN